MEDKIIRLSASKLSLMTECPLCFWNAEHGVKRPRGAFPTLPGGMDATIKKYCDNFRGKLPPELEGRVRGTLLTDLKTIKRWRNWKVGLTYQDDTLGVEVIGALDDCLTEHPEGSNTDGGLLHIPIDFKTKGWKPKDDGSQYYQVPLDCYHLLLEANGHATGGLGYLAYFYPYEASAGPFTRLNVEFQIELYELKCDSKRTKVLIEKAVNMLHSKAPEPGPKCEYCGFFGDRMMKEMAGSQNTLPTEDEG